MKRPTLILLAGVLAALLAYGGVYLGCKEHAAALAGPEPELAWLKAEFQLPEAEFARICRMHEAYLAGCAERCRIIDQKNHELRRLLAGTNTVTGAIEQNLLASAQLRAECQKQMLLHFYEVSRTMPPEQGRRYLAWVQDQTVLADTHSGMRAARPESGPSSHAHH